MSKNSRNITAFVISYFITRLGFYLLGYNPFENNSFWIGLAIDFGIWVVVFIGVSTLLTKLFKSRS
ncbi:MAG: hypothetical protein HUJ16_10590 [Kangiella sp.]|nr:hypothetical protein [Kangiella sp.]